MKSYHTSTMIWPDGRWLNRRRRLARLVDAPFVKVEATKFTEVGYVGRDVESIIRDLVEASVRICKEKASRRSRCARPCLPRSASST